MQINMELQHATVSLRGVEVCAEKPFLDTSWNYQVVGADTSTSVLCSVQSHLLLRQSNTNSLILRTNSEKQRGIRDTQAFTLSHGPD
jgi:hypothetical protein